MEEDIDYFFLVNKETDNEEELINIGEDLMQWQIAIGSIPEDAKIELIKHN
tara:strand:+ start:612 stop:764 length:153 start_codon:yes stop_codon:yes gene_type:complete